MHSGQNIKKVASKNLYVNEEILEILGILRISEHFLE
jgi:hypothetical protein